LFQAVVGTHGEILLEAPTKTTEQVALTLKKTMEEAGSLFLKIVPVKAEEVIGSSWAEK
jgi:DNA polymerase I-like protein with 3'-5' exonuclease and polymerase domains